MREKTKAAMDRRNFLRAVGGVSTAAVAAVASPIAATVLGLAMLHVADESGNVETHEDFSEDATNGEDKAAHVQDRIRQFSTAVAPVLLPMIDQLSGLNQEDLEILSAIGEDI